MHTRSMYYTQRPIRSVDSFGSLGGRSHRYRNKVHITNNHSEEKKQSGGKISVGTGEGHTRSMSNTVNPFRKRSAKKRMAENHIGQKVTLRGTGKWKKKSGRNTNESVENLTVIRVRERSYRTPNGRTHEFPKPRVWFVRSTASPQSAYRISLEG